MLFAKGLDGICYDVLYVAGEEDGEYELGGQKFCKE